MHAGIILCGGHSIRMGRDKAWLPFGPETMLQRVARRLGEAVGPVLVVAVADHQLPELPPDVRIVCDRRPDRGPLEGLAAGLAALPDDIEAAFVTGCDVPLLVPAFVRRMFELLGPNQIAVPRVDGRLHPLAAVYRQTMLPLVERRLTANQLRLMDLCNEVPTRFVTAEELRAADPQLDSLRNLNRPVDYNQALADTCLPD